jgi:hypothetical protein
VELGKDTLLKLENLKKSADKELKLAEKMLSAADAAKVKAGGRLLKATVEASDAAAQVDSAKADLKQKVVAADAATAAANDATKKSDKAKELERSAVRVVELRKATLEKLENLKKKADAEIKPGEKRLSATDNGKGQTGAQLQMTAAEVAGLAEKIKRVKLDLKTRVTAAAVVTKIAHDAVQKSDEAKKVEDGTAHQVVLQKETLGKLEILKKSADTELSRANEAFTAADKDKVQAEERLGEATAETVKMVNQFVSSKADLKAKVEMADAATVAANDAAQARDEAKKVEKSALREVALHKTTLRKLESLKKRADSELKRADKALSVADKTRVQAEERLQNATAEATDLAMQVDTAKSDLEEKIATADAAKEAVKTAKSLKAESAKAAYEAKLALEPVSVYISRATQRLYVRRNTHEPARDGGGKVFDASIEVPVTIHDPDKPIGTHIFTAMESNDSGLRWTVVTIDNGEDARRALDRVTIPQEVFERIALTALPRSSIIISDEPLSRETNYRTEFVAVLSNQPQGGFITRKITQNLEVEESDEDGDSEESGFVRRSPNFLGL